MLQAPSDGSIFTDPPSLLMRHNARQVPVNIQPLRSFLQHEDTASSCTSGCDGSSLDSLNKTGEEESLDLPDEVLQKWGHVLDIVTPDSLSTNCFTKTYTRFAKVGAHACILSWISCFRDASAVLRRIICYLCTASQARCDGSLIRRQFTCSASLPVQLPTEIRNR